MDAREHERRVGTTLAGKWKIERLLGVGGMAAVYVAAHRLGRRETLKILHADAAKSDTLRGRLEREARAANRVDHPAVVPIRDVDVTDDGCPFLVMDYVEGETLSARVARLGRIDASELVPWAEEILGALENAHARGIIHRDIKPENLLVQTDGRIRLLDFGIAKMTGEPDGVKTQTGVTLGTASYMPPEQIRGGAIDGRADLFALAATMFRALAGRHIHGPLASEGDLLVRMATERAPALRSIAPDVPEGIAKVVDLGLELDARRRYPDAATMRDDLRCARAGDQPPFAALSEGERDRTAAARGPVTAPIAVPSAWDDAPPLPTQHAKTPVSIDASPAPAPATAALALVSSASGAVKTVPASSRRWAPVGRVVYGIGGVLCAFFGLVLWLAFYDAKTRASVYVLMLLLATFPLAIAALLFARARTAHLAIRRPTEEAMRAVLAQAYASDARVAPGEIAAKSGVPIDDAAQALDALTSAGAARRETTAEGYVVYAVARSRGAG